MDIKKLEAEISNRKLSKTKVASNLGERVNIRTPHDSFLNGLVTSLKSGVENDAVNKIKLVENEAAIKKGDKPKFNIRETQDVVRNRISPPSQTRSKTQVNEDNDREEKLFQSFRTSNKNTLADALSTYNKPAGNNGGYTPQYQQQMNEQVHPNMVNEQILAENVKNVVDKYLVENFGSMLEETMKNTIIEMYAIERITQVINENEDLIKKIVYKTIREIKNKGQN